MNIVWRDQNLSYTIILVIIHIHESQLLIFINKSSQTGLQVFVLTSYVPTLVIWSSVSYWYHQTLPKEREVGRLSSRNRQFLGSSLIMGGCCFADVWIVKTYTIRSILYPYPHDIPTIPPFLMVKSPFGWLKHVKPPSLMLKITMDPPSTRFSFSWALHAQDGGSALLGPRCCHHHDYCEYAHHYYIHLWS